MFYFQFASETAMTNPILREAAIVAKDVPVYLYEMSYEGKAHEYMYRWNLPSKMIILCNRS